MANRLLNFKVDNLTDAELSVVNKIIENPEFFISRTITELAKEYYVSESTITRLAKHLGFQNIKKLQMHIYNRAHFLNQNYETNDSLNLKSIANNMRVYYSYSIHETVDNIDLNALDGLINDLIIKKRIFIFGIGSSYLACRVLNSNLNLIGYTSFSTEDIHALMVMIQNITPDDLLIIFSRSGRTKEVQNVIALAEKLNLVMAIITSNRDLKQLYSFKHFISFEIHSEDKQRFPAVSSKIVQMLVADIIFNSILKINPRLNDKIIAANDLTEQWNNIDKK
ncbi:MurR/RpiR family transcriptional regulator [Spiroplasma chrysopicola]|uniref:RpiR family transcriptional regulator n=1 Tax=Spiroplasma chrysopicola DF-1 TaxID=1276227 RepID=R4UJ60_9MOLU|nr:MurR/RpiR family transcriptional regulator [Spiroplasma chrysopicola]AGM25356.1 RpiR family transcriptional regulator [Spiroplasma chrysopicola DF-1]